MTILHLARLDDCEAAQVSGEYRVSSRDLSLDDAGFIHASTEEQLADVAERVYFDAPDDLVVLELDEDAITADGVEVRYEEGGDGDLYPHIYGPINPEWVVTVRTALFDDGEFVVD